MLEIEFENGEWLDICPGDYDDDDPLERNLLGCFSGRVKVPFSFVTHLDETMTIFLDSNGKFCFKSSTTCRIVKNIVGSP